MVEHPWKWSFLFYVLFMAINLIMNWNYWGKTILIEGAKENPIKLVFFPVGSYLIVAGFVFLYGMLCKRFTESKPIREVP